MKPTPKIEVQRDGTLWIWLDEGNYETGYAPDVTISPSLTTQILLEYAERVHAGGGVS